MLVALECYLRDADTGGVGVTPLKMLRPLDDEGTVKLWTWCVLMRYFLTKMLVGEDVRGNAYSSPALPKIPSDTRFQR